MRLLDVHQLKLKQFFDEKTRPPYAILSHTWGQDEVSHQDLQTPAATSMIGYSKIKRCCKLAIQEGFKYVWIDTCCIDKTSSSELSEAINSMYHWYKSATICYVYLSDVKTGDDPGHPESSFSKSRWFTRGWTLQELLAPKIVTFYNGDWAEIGTKFSLQDDISRITGIPCEVLSTGSLDEISVAQRMSWAAMRETTRVEDIAYCLMGMFSVNMPTLYGEGRRAFIRLQYEIMKSSDDHSLFAWASTWTIDGVNAGDLRWDDGGGVSNLFYSDRGAESGLLATSPSQFIYSGRVQRLKVTDTEHPYSMTNKGLHIWLPVVEIPGQQIYRAILSCEMLDGDGPLCIYLTLNPSGQYSRILTSIVRTVPHMEDDKVEDDGVEDDNDFVEDDSDSVEDDNGRLEDDNVEDNNVEGDLKPIELYVKEVYPDESETPLPLELDHFEEITFKLVGNPSSEGFTVLQCGPTSRWNQNMQTFRLSESLAHNSSYIIVGAKNDLAARALVILGVRDPPFKSRFFCAIYSEGSEMHEAYRHIDQNGEPEKGYFGSVIKDFNADRITKQLATGHTISVAIRPGPGTPNYRVMITFKPPFGYRTNRHVKSSHIAPRPVPRPNPRETLSLLPKLTIYLDAESEIITFYPKFIWSTLPVEDLDGPQTLIWNPTRQHKSGLLGLFTSEGLFLLIFRFIESDVTLEFIAAPPDLGNDELSSYLDEPNPLQSSRTCQFLKDIPQKGLKLDKGIQVKIKPRVFLHEVGCQLLVIVRKKTNWSRQMRRDVQMILREQPSWGQVSQDTEDDTGFHSTSANTHVSAAVEQYGTRAPHIKYSGIVHKI